MLIEEPIKVHKRPIKVGVFYKNWFNLKTQNAI